MVVVAVGEFDKAAIENLVTNHFASMPAATTPRPRPTYDIPDRTETGYALTTDKETSTTTVEVDTLLPAREQGSVGAHKQKTVDRLFSGMLSARFSDLTQKPDAPFVFAFVGRGRFLARTKEASSLIAVVKEDGIDRALEALLPEPDRVWPFGVTG